MVQVFVEQGGRARELVQRACFGYLALGGIYARGFQLLTAGLDERPYMSLLHSLGVAVTGIKIFFSSKPWQ